MDPFGDQPLVDILNCLRKQVTSRAPGERLTFIAARPELKGSAHDGSPISTTEGTIRARSLRCWVNLAEALGCRLLTPEIVDHTWMRLTLEKLNPDESWHDAETGDITEKYGVDTPFAAIDKREDPAYLVAFTRAFRRISLPEEARILDLGVNSGDEIALIRSLMGERRFGAARFDGVDHAPSAIARAGERFPGENVRLHCADINQLKTLDLGRYHLILSIGTLQSPGIDTKPLFMSLVQDHLTEDGAVILGFPNCRYTDGEVVYGAKVKNYSEPELSLLIKDIYFVKKYLQQHRFQVTLFGKHYLFLVGTPG